MIKTYKKEIKEEYQKLCDAAGQIEDSMAAIDDNLQNIIDYYKSEENYTGNKKAQKIVASIEELISTMNNNVAESNYYVGETICNIYDIISITNNAT